MLAQVSERTMRTVRGGLAAGWLVLILTLIPTPRGDGLAVSSLRFFWGVIIPLLPLVLLVFGHETWRRICPLSQFSQLPRYLGLQHKWKVFNRDRGKIERRILIIPQNSFIRRYHGYIQFFFLAGAVCLRIVWANNNPTALAVMLISLIVMSTTVGYLFGGKAWCHYFCPLAPVQKVFTGPGALFESKPYKSKLPIVQSMCRTPTAGGPDVSACVGCRSSCPDIDLERSYWDELGEPSRQLASYGYIGLMIGFGTYFACLGNCWDYFLTGAFSKGGPAAGGRLFQILPQIWLPSYLIAPVIIAVSIAASYLLGRAAEWSSLAIKRHKNQDADPEQNRHQCYSIATFIAFNLFYYFLGHAVVHGLPPALMAFAEWSVAALSSIWLWRTLFRSSDQYRRETTAGSLLKQLSQFSSGLASRLGKRSLEELNVDEIYVLAKTLPGFHRDQRLAAYQAMLKNALASGAANSSSSLELLSEVRIQLDINEEDHRATLDRIGVDDHLLLDPKRAFSEETRARLEGYRAHLQQLIARHTKAGHSAADFFECGSYSNELEALCSAYNISACEHQDLVAEFSGGSPMLFIQGTACIEELKSAARLMAALSASNRKDSPFFRLLEKEILRRRKKQLWQCFSYIEALGETDEALWLAHACLLLAGDDAALALKDLSSQRYGQSLWSEVLSLKVQSVIIHGLSSAEVSQRKGHLPPAPRYADLLIDSPTAAKILPDLIRGGDGILAALSLRVLNIIAPRDAAVLAEELSSNTRQVHPLYREEVSKLLPIPRGAAADVKAGQFSRRNTLSTAALLSAVPLFSKLEVPSLIELAAVAERRAFRAGTDVMKIGRAITSLLLLEQGRAEANIASEDGLQHSGEPIEIFAPIGELDLLMSRPSKQTVTVVSTYATFTALPVHSVREILSRDPGASKHALRLMHGHFERTIQKQQSNALIASLKNVSCR